MVSQDRWSLLAGSATRTVKFRTFCQEYVVCQDRWSLMAVVSQYRFYSNPFGGLILGTLTVPMEHTHSIYIETDINYTEVIISDKCG